MSPDLDRRVSEAERKSLASIYEFVLKCSNEKTEKVARPEAITRKLGDLKEVCHVNE